LLEKVEDLLLVVGGERVGLEVAVVLLEDQLVDGKGVVLGGGGLGRGGGVGVGEVKLKAFEVAFHVLEVHSVGWVGRVIFKF
jgi:hypothetical protein